MPARFMQAVTIQSVLAHQHTIIKSHEIPASVSRPWLPDGWVR